MSWPDRKNPPKNEDTRQNLDHPNENGGILAFHQPWKLNTIMLWNQTWHGKREITGYDWSNSRQKDIEKHHENTKARTIHCRDILSSADVLQISDKPIVLGKIKLWQSIKQKYCWFDPHTHSPIQNNDIWMNRWSCILQNLTSGLPRLQKIYFPLRLFGTPKEHRIWPPSKAMFSTVYATSATRQTFRSSSYFFRSLRLNSYVPAR